MSLLRKVLAGLMVGLGKGMEEQAKIDIQKARDDLLYSRELALKNVEQQYRLEAAEHGSGLRKEEAEHQGEITRKNTSHTATENRVSATHEGNIRGTLDEKKDYRQQGHEERMARLTATLGERRDRASIRARAAIESGEIVDTRQDETGNWIGITRHGVTKPLGFRSPLPESADGETSDSGGGSLADYRSGGQSGGAAQPERWSAQDENQFRTRYNNATKETAPRLYRGDTRIPYEEARRMARGY